MELEFPLFVNSSGRGISVINRIARNVFDGDSIVLLSSILELNSTREVISAHSVALDFPFKLYSTGPVFFFKH